MSWVHETEPEPEAPAPEGRARRRRVFHDWLKFLQFTDNCARSSSLGAEHPSLGDHGSYSYESSLVRSLRR